MSAAVLKTAPLLRTGKCCVCGDNDVELSMEHVIPRSIGGCLRTYGVCKMCNSRLGKLIDAPFVKALRHSQHPEDEQIIKFELLKIAYEFSAEQILGYVYDKRASQIAKALLKADPERLARIDVIEEIPSFMDPSDEGKHLISLSSGPEGVVCHVLLFGKYHGGFVMSESKGSFPTLLAVNDFINNKLEYRYLTP